LGTAAATAVATTAAAEASASAAAEATAAVATTAAAEATAATAEATAATAEAAFGPCRPLALGMREVDDETSTSKVRGPQSVRCRLGRLIGGHGHEAKAALATVWIRRQVDPHDRVGRHAVDHRFDFFLGAVVGQVADVQRPIGRSRCRTASARSATGRARRTADGTAASGTTHHGRTRTRRIATRGFRLERTYRDGFARVDGSIEGVASGLCLRRGHERHETEPPRPSRGSVLRKAYVYDGSACRFEELLENFFRNAVG
jgi:hypothetical protein